jgi:glycosyltransferase involved in cell wall biosynthesis
VTAVTIVAHEVGTVGGMERQLATTIEGLLDAGHEVTVVARTCLLPPRPGLRWVRVRGPRRPFSIAYPWFFLAGSLAVARARRGLLQTTGAVVLNRADISTVHFCHRAFQERSDELRTSRPGLLYSLNARLCAWMSVAGERWCFRPRVTRRLVAVSRGLASELERFFPAMADAVTVIPNGVDRAAFKSDPGSRQTVRAHLRLGDDDLLALFVGGDWERKGLRFAVEAVARRPRWRLVVVGDGDRDRYEQLAERDGAGGRVVFVGRQPEPQRWYAAADAFVLPTAYETFSLVAFEAAAAGVPLLVTRVSGVEDVLVDGHNGWFVERDAGSIAARLEQLEGDPALRAALGEAARRSSEPYGWDAAVAGYRALYDDAGREHGEHV